MDIAERMKKEQEKIQALYQTYHEHRERIEALWKKNQEQNFPQRLRDELWKECTKGQIALTKVIAGYLSQKKKQFAVPRNVPAYKRAVMLLEKEKKYADALKLCTEYIENGKAVWRGFDDPWYEKKTGSLRKKVLGNK